MDKIGKVIAVVDQSLNTRERRHIVGGVLLSVSLLFGGLAITVLSLREEKPDELEMVYSEEKDTYIIQSKGETK